jgi:NCS1 family nucleobase:cation symporter-1
MINVVGFAGATGREVPLAATRIYQMSFFTGFGVSALVYWSLNAFSPVPGKSKTLEEVDLTDYIYEEEGDSSSFEKNHKAGEVYTTTTKEVDSEKGSVA